MALFENDHLAFEGARGAPTAIVLTYSGDALASIGSQAVPFVIEKLNDEEMSMRWAAAAVLHNMEIKEARDAVPALKECLDDESEVVRSMVIDTLNRILEAQQQ
jgi:HEAT repeat protein